MGLSLALIAGVLQVLQVVLEGCCRHAVEMPQCCCQVPTVTGRSPRELAEALDDFATSLDAVGWHVAGAPLVCECVESFALVEGLLATSLAHPCSASGVGVAGVAPEGEEEAVQLVSARVGVDLD